LQNEVVSMLTTLGCFRGEAEPAGQLHHHDPSVASRSDPVLGIPIQRCRITAPTMSALTFKAERLRAINQSTERRTASASVGRPKLLSTSVKATTPASGIPATPIAATMQ